MGDSDFIVGRGIFDTLKDASLFNGLRLKMKEDQKEYDTPLPFAKYFNPDLATDSDYFKSLEKAFDCVNKHAGRELSERE